MEKKQRSELKKTLSPSSVWAVALGSIIGWGCFIQAANWTERAGGPLPLCLGFIAGGILMVIIGFSYSYMIAKFPVAGGEFAYAYKGFGKTAAYICGWMLSLGYVSIVALNATALPVLVSYIFPNMLDFGYMYTIAGYDVYAGEALLSCFFIVVFGIMNYRGVKSTGKLQLIMVLIMCCAVLVSVFGTIFTGSFEVNNFQPIYGENKSFFAGFISTVALAPFLYVGFDCIPQAAEEYDFPAKKAKLLVISSILVGSIIYILMALVTDSVVPWRELMRMTDPATGEVVNWHTGAVLEMAMGRLGVGFVALAVSMGIFTGLNGFFMTSSRLLFGMARAKMLPEMFEKIHPKYQTPNVCVVFTLLVCCICPFFGREVITWVVDMCSVGTAFGYFFTCAGAYILVKHVGEPGDENKISPLVAMLGCMISVGILLLLIVPGSPAFMSMQSFIALGGWILLGSIFYFVSVKSFSKVTKRQMDYLILGNVQVIRGLRKDSKKQDRIEAEVVIGRQ